MARHRSMFAMLPTLAGILILASGCMEASPTTVQLDPSGTAALSKSHVAGVYQASIGPDGGTLEFSIGQIVFPAGAVSRNTTITARVDGKTIAVDFQPHLVFPDNAQPALTLSYAGVDVDPTGLVVVHIQDSGVLAEVLSPTLNLQTSEATVHAPGFSGFALASQ